MNYNLISQLVSNGMNGEEILPLLIRNAPQLASKIKKLVVGGWGPNEVLLALQKDPDMGKVSLKNAKPSTPEEIAALKVYQGRRSPDKSRDEQALAQLRSFTGMALKTGAAIGGGILGGRALQAGAQMLGDRLQGGTSPTPPMPGAPPQPQGQIPPDPSPAPQSPSPGPSLDQAIPEQAKAPVTQAMQPQSGNILPPPPEAQQQQRPDLNAIMEQSGAKNIIDALRDKNPPDVIAGVVRKQLGQKSQALEQMAQKPLERLITDYVQSSPPPPDIKEKIAQGVQTPGMNPTNILQPQQPQQMPQGKEDISSIGGMAKGMMGNFYEGIFKSLQDGKDTFSGVKDPLISKAKPLFDKGLIKSPEDLKEFAQNPDKFKEKPERPKLDINLSKDGRFTPISETIRPGKLPSNSIGRKLSDVTYEQKYKDLNPKEKEAFKIIDDAIDKTAKHLVSGKTFTDLLPMKEGNVVQLSTAEDVLRSLLGVPSKYNLMTPEEQEETFNTFQGITPNVIWNTISLIDPRIQKIQRPNPSPKGAKSGKTEMSPNDFRRFLAHSVIGMMEKNKDFGPRAQMIVSVVNMLDKFEKKKSKSDSFPDFQSLSDDEFNALMAEVSDEEVKKYR